ncbi:AraC family transcriptional regulator [Gulosibacter macacae]|uniref:AraC family transcriptional regulator n=1 Tax=Gulosibacter macacae TaxID=2488791 RepID=A0A3P3VZU5_9MICO|nr:AraC family transcriptional regulator [Gulosibacter macacae]RRJ86203.1 AraC family transcriptional regulator [Gulosibacter macacae]
MTEFARSTALPYFEARRSCQTNTCYRPHTHDAFSVGVVDEGVSVFAGVLTGKIELMPGDVIVIPAEHVHQCNPVGGEWLYRMLHIEQSWAEQAADAQSPIDPFAAIAVYRGARIRSLIDRWLDELFEDAPASLLEATRDEVIHALSHTVPELRVTVDRNEHLLDELAPVFARLRSDEVNPSLDDLGALVGMDRYRLVREVKRATGLPPLAWRQNARIAESRRMLREGMPIADAAIALGFTDQSHFHRVFRAHVAAAPGGYRA